MKKIILTVILILISVMILPSCKKNDGQDRQPCSPAGGQFDIRLIPEEWTVLTLSFEQSLNQLGIFHNASETTFIINCYDKASLASEKVSDINDFYDYYKTLGNENDSDESSGPEQTARTGDLVDVAKKDIGGSVVKTGKRQEFYTDNTNMGNFKSEIIYLETENYFITIAYGNLSEKFDASKKIANEIISNIKTERK